MLDIIKILGSVIIILVLLELFELPDWIGRKLRGDISNKEIKEEIKSLETRIKNLEEKVD
ncbi:MAG: hypothetical protein FH751_00035 [Firmicutes bacterium]|nr:hypothetical protein [Bacillota bacterium]